MTILKEIDIHQWDMNFDSKLQNSAIAALENGQILLFPQLAFTLSDCEKIFLSPNYAHPKAKNISFNTHDNSLRCGPCSKEDYENLRKMLMRFSQTATQFVQGLLPQYAAALQIGRTSYRPVEIAGRASSYRKDDTRLHVDAFPATPNQGRRIIRVFSNINPYGQDRLWRVGEPFHQVAKQFLPDVRKRWFGEACLLHALKITKSKRTDYDHIMLNIHDAMKRNLAYQTNAEQKEVRFTPNSTWIVQTDHVSHAAMGGQYLLEQTFYLPVEAMVTPDLSPLKTLEKLLGKSLA